MGKTKAVKTKKALKRMDRAEELLSKLLKQFAEARDGVRELLSASRTSVLRARAKVKVPPKKASTPAVKSSVKAKPVVSAKQSAPATKRRTARSAKSKRTARSKALEPGSTPPVQATPVLH